MGLTSVSGLDMGTVSSSFGEFWSVVVSAGGSPLPFAPEFASEYFLFDPAPPCSTIFCFRFPLLAVIALISFSTFCRSDTVMNGVDLTPCLG